MSVNPVPAALAQTLPNPRTPWHVSPRVFSRLQFQPSQTDPYTKCEITRDDPEWKFVATYFDNDPPVNRMIRRIFCIHNPSSTARFEASIPIMEQEATNAHFSPSWHKESNLPLREKAFKRWEDSVQPFSPFFIASASGRKDIYKHVKIVPLWQGSTESKCHSIVQTGFAFFGKTNLRGGAAEGSTDAGFFGSGIYFTNSARYAADIYSDGNLILAWTSMREPFPVVSGKAVLPPEEPSDMRALKGKGAYKNYNAHYVPVISVDPSNKDCPVYYPCAAGQAPMCDEYAFFQPAQTLPRFWVELDVALLKNPSMASASLVSTVGELFDHILELSENRNVKKNKDLSLFFEKKIAILAGLDQTDSLSQEDEKIYTFTKKLLDGTGEVREVIVKQLLPAKPAASAPPQKTVAPSVQSVPAAAVSHSVAAASASLPEIAFGALKWKQYFGLDVQEPPLPANIDEILNSPCPFFSTFFSKKKIKKTHFLTLVPEGMTLEKLESLTLNPKQGNKMGCRNKGSGWVQYSKTSSGRAHWILMPNDVIPGSRKKTWADQQVMAASYKSQGYELLSMIDGSVCLLLEHVQTGKRFYSDSPLTYTRCSEQVKEGSSQWSAAIGGFASGGLCVSDSDGVATESFGLGVARVRLEAQ